MIYLQIKAKSGLHAGATWRMEKPLVTLGASTKADVFLCDPDVPDNLITLRKIGRKLRIEGLSNQARLRRNDNREETDFLLPSQTATLDFRQVQLELQVVVEKYNMASLLGDRFIYLVHDALNLLRSLGVKAFFGLLFIISLLLTALVLFFGTAGVVKSEASVLHKDAPQKQLEMAKVAPLPIEQHMANNVAQEMQNLFLQIKAQNFHLDVNNEQVTIKAVLSRSQSVQFERTLARQSQDYGQYVDIQATLEFTDEQKIIDSLNVERVVLGARPALVLRDGAMLYVGGTYQGMEVVSIGARRIVLQGDTTYEVTL